MKPSDELVTRALIERPMTLGQLVAALSGRLSERSIRDVRKRLPGLVVTGTGRSAVLSIKPEVIPEVKPEVLPVSLPVSGMGGVGGGPDDFPRTCRDQEIAAAAAAEVKPEVVPEALPVSLPELTRAALRARIEREEAERDYWRDRNRREQEAHDERARVSRDEGGLAHRDLKPENVPVEPPTPEEEACIKERLEQLKDEGKPARNEPYMRRLILRDVREDEATRAALSSAAQARAFKLEQQKAKKEAVKPVVMKPADWEVLRPRRERAGAT